MAWSVTNSVFAQYTFFGSTFVLFLNQLGLEKSQIGGLLSLLPFLGIIAVFIAAPVARIGHKRTFLISMAARTAIAALLLLTPLLLALGQGGGPSDGSNAVALAAFSQQPIESLGGITLDEYYDKVVSSIAQSSASEGALAEGAQTFRDSLQSQREQYSGVSIDEETINVMKFQRAFQSAARLVSTIDELFTILLQI